MKSFFLSILVLILFIPIARASYEDVANDNPYLEGITYLELEGAIDNTDQFRPNDKLKRVELFKILFTLLGEEKPESSTTFNDVPKEAWFAPYTELAFHYGLVEAGNGLFEPEKAVKQIEALEILSKAYGIPRPLISSQDRTRLFHDVSSNHPHYPTLRWAIDADIIALNPDENFLPYRTLTREEFANLILSFEEWKTAMQLEAEELDFYKSDIFANIWNQITSIFYLEDGQSIDQDALFQAAVKGMLESLEDPYSVYLTSEQGQNFYESLNGDFEGIGIYLSQDENTGEWFVGNFVNEEAPAKKAGLKAGDKITAVDGTPITRMLLEEVVHRIKGPANTTVKLTIEREGQTLSFTITRKAISIILERAEIIQRDVWYLEIDSFSNLTAYNAFDLLAGLTLEEPDPRAIVLDLRGNPGGYLSSGNAVAGLFVPHLTPLVHLDYGSFQETIYNGDIGPYYGIPLYILVDEYTASAAEIVTATIKERGTATVIGKQTFGKGTAQQLISFWDNSILKLTIAEWLTADGNSINGIGITPDILITETNETVDLWLKEVEEQLK